MKEHVFMKKYDLKHARNYTYRHGEVERIARARFERALKTGDLHEFPNVAFFYKKYVLDRDIALKEIKDKKEELRDYEYQINESDDENGHSKMQLQPRKDFKKDKPWSNESRKLINQARDLIDKNEKIIEDRS